VYKLAVICKMRSTDTMSGGGHVAHKLHTAQNVYLCSLQMFLHGSVNVCGLRHYQTEITYSQK